MTTILRAVHIRQFSNYQQDPDDGVLFGVFTVVEMGSCLAAVAAMALRPLFKKLKLLSPHYLSYQHSAPAYVAHRAARITVGSEIDVEPLHPMDRQIHVYQNLEPQKFASDRQSDLS